MKVLITGTASGIGKGCAEFFLKENHEVYGFDKNISSINIRNILISVWISETKALIRKSDR